MFTKALYLFCVYTLMFIYLSFFSCYQSLTGKAVARNTVTEVITMLLHR